MYHATMARSLIIALAGLAAASLETAHADVTLEERISVQGAGLLSMGNMSGTTLKSVSGDRAREESRVQIESRLVRYFAHGAGAGGTTRLIRLDQEKIYTLDLARKEYTEVSLAEQRAELQSAVDQASESRGQQPAPTGMDESQCDWSQPSMEVKSTGKTATIAGLGAEETAITASQSCTDRKTGAVCDVALWVDMWLAPNAQAIEEATRFDRSYAQKMGIASLASSEATRQVESLFSRYKAAWQQASSQAQALKGYPVRSTVALGFGGPQCRGAGSPAAAPSQQAGASTPSGASLQQDVAESAGQTAGERAASGTGFGALAGRLGGKLAGGLFGKKKDAEANSSSAQSPATAGGAADPLTARGMAVPVRYTVELVSIKNDPLSADTFEVPAGFRKVEALRR